MKYAKIAFILTVIVSLALLVYYAPVVDRLVRFCDHYPEFTQDCKGE